MLARLYHVLTAMDADWIDLAEQAPHVGAGGDPHQVLLRILALHPTSVEYYQRFAESLDDLYNRMRLSGGGTDFMRALEAAIEASRAMDLLRRLSYQGDAPPDALQQLLLQPRGSPERAAHRGRPALGNEPELHASTDDPWNYLEWLRDAASRSLDALREERGFTGNTPPKALLYLLARHALLQAYWDTSLKLGEDRGVMTPEAVKAARHESPFIHVQTEPRGGESRWGTLYAVRRADHRRPDRPRRGLHYRRDRRRTRHVAVERDAGRDRLIERPADRASRTVARRAYRHLQLPSRRLAAGVPALRAGADARTRARPFATACSSAPSAGSRTCGRRRARSTRAVAGRSRRLVSACRRAAARPRLDQRRLHSCAVAQPGRRRGRAAQRLSGQRHAGKPGRLRCQPLVATGPRGASPCSRGCVKARASARCSATSSSAGCTTTTDWRRSTPSFMRCASVSRCAPIGTPTRGRTRTYRSKPSKRATSSTACALVEYVKGRSSVAYPFGLTLPAATRNERDAIDAEVMRLLDTADAVADVKIADSVYQAVQGNYDAVAATLDSSASGQLPTAPAIVEHAAQRTRCRASHGAASRLRSQRGRVGDCGDGGHAARPRRAGVESMARRCPAGARRGRCARSRGSTRRRTDSARRR